MAANELIDYLENGNITNSVNYPSASMPRSGKTRICMMHKNVPSILAQISAVISGEGINIENMINKSRGDYAYTILDVGEDVGENSLSKISTIEGMIKVNTYR